MVKFSANPSRPWVIAHRGARGGHRLHSPTVSLPENSAAAFARAQQLGVDGIETDVRLSQDHVPILCHDNSLKRLAGVDRWIGDCTAAELEQLGFLRLDQAVREFGQQPIFLELKDEAADPLARRKALVEETLAVVDAHSKSLAAGKEKTELLLLSFSDQLLHWAAELDCGLRCGRNMETAELHPYDYLSCQIDGLRADFVAAAHDAGQPVITWTVSTSAELHHALQCGVDGIISDHPAWLQHELARR